MARCAPSGHLQFPHHTLSADESRGEVSRISVEDAVAEFDPTNAGFASVAKQLRDANVRHILLIHGTFAGGDITGFVREVKRFSPVRASRIDEISKAWLMTSAP